MRDKTNLKSFNEKQRLDQDRQLLERVQNEIDVDASKRVTSTEALKNEFMVYND